jgi:hypothetical protein
MGCSLRSGHELGQGRYALADPRRRQRPLCHVVVSCRRTQQERGRIAEHAIVYVRVFNDRSGAGVVPFAVDDKADAQSGRENENGAECWDRVDRDRHHLL